MNYSTPVFPVLHHLLESAQTHVHWVGDAIQQSRPLSSPSPASWCPFPASGSFPLRWLFTSSGQSIGASALASNSYSNEYSGLISFRTDWFDGVLLWHHSLKASILQSSDFFMVQLSHPYKNTGKTTALTIWTFVGKIISLLLNMLSRLVIAFLPRNKCLLISWVQSLSAVILEPK